MCFNLFCCFLFLVLFGKSKKISKHNRKIKLKKVKFHKSPKSKSISDLGLGKRLSLKDNFVSDDFHLHKVRYNRNLKRCLSSAANNRFLFAYSYLMKENIPKEILDLLKEHFFNQPRYRLLIPDSIPSNLSLLRMRLEENALKNADVFAVAILTIIRAGLPQNIQYMLYRWYHIKRQIPLITKPQIVTSNDIISSITREKEGVLA